MPVFRCGSLHWPILQLQLVIFIWRLEFWEENIYIWECIELAPCASAYWCFIRLSSKLLRTWSSGAAKTNQLSFNSLLKCVLCYRLLYKELVKVKVLANLFCSEAWYGSELWIVCIYVVVISEYKYLCCCWWLCVSSMLFNHIDWLGFYNTKQAPMLYFSVRSQSTCHFHQ
jgi:hypothetical protein